MNRPHQAPHRWPGVAAWFALVALVLSACGGAPAAPAATSAGRLVLWEPERRMLIAQDAVLGRGCARPGWATGSPPPYYDAGSYIATLARLRALQPEWLLTAHYDYARRGGRHIPGRGPGVRRAGRCGGAGDRAPHGGRPLTLSTVIAALDARLGPFDLTIQWPEPGDASIWSTTDRRNPCEHTIDRAD
ncbi:MAG: hypothetical protein U0Z44_07840 [Kouleothrix sp.]